MSSEDEYFCGRDVFVEWKKKLMVISDMFGLFVCFLFGCLVVCFFVFLFVLCSLMFYSYLRKVSKFTHAFSQRLNGYNTEFTFYSSFKQVRSYSSHTSSQIPDFCVLFDGLNRSLSMIGTHKESATGHFWIACWYGLYWAAYHSKEQPVMKTTNSYLRLQWFFLWMAHVVLVPIPSMHDIISLYIYIYLKHQRFMQANILLVPWIRHGYVGSMLVPWTERRVEELKNGSWADFEVLILKQKRQNAPQGVVPEPPD